MHGLIFVTWEKYLVERFGFSFLHDYRQKIGATAADIPLANRFYDDATLLAGVGAAHELSKLPVDTLLQEYGRYFIINGLTSYLCAYILTNVKSARELLLVMRDAHDRLRHSASIQPPLFKYEQSADPSELILIYDSPRQLCSLLRGAIEGAAERFGETVRIEEQSCMKQGAATCRIKISFVAPQADPRRSASPERAARQAAQTTLMRQIWDVLPDVGSGEGFTMPEIQGMLKKMGKTRAEQLRPALLFEALNRLQFAGYITSSAPQADDILHRRYWRMQKHM